MSEICFRDIRTNGIRLHVAQCGGDTGRFAILLHGFPEFWYGWRHQICALARSGLRIWAPDQRGYNLSDKPTGVRAYSLDELAKDVIGLVDSAGESQVILVGHDWGAAVAWWAAMNFPDRISRLVILNVPHPIVMRRYLWCSLKQLRRSWYVFYFQLPWFPEILSSMGNWRLIIRAMELSSLPGTFSAKDWDKYRKAWSESNAFRSMIHWYRAALRFAPSSYGRIRLSVPTLMIWGARDRFLGRELAQPSIDLCDAGRLVFVEEATHWVHHEAPNDVNELILDHVFGVAR